MHSITSNFLWNGMLKLFAVVFPLITFPYVTRCLGADSLGKVSFASSIISYFSLCANLGIPTYGIRACSKVRDDKAKLSKTVHELLFINSVTTIIAYIGLLLCVEFIPRLSENKILMIILSISLPFSCIGMEWLYSAIEEYRYITIRSFVFKIISLILLFTLVKNKDDYLQYAAITVVAAVGSNFFNLIQIRKIIYIYPQHRYEFKKHLKPIINFFAASIAILIYTHIDTAMLGFLSSDIEVGYYTVAVKIKTVLLNVITSIGVVLLPRISYYLANHQKETANQLIRKTIHLIFLITIPLVLFFELESYSTINIIAGKEYYPAIDSMNILTPLLFVVGMANVMVYQYILPRGMEKQYCYITILSATIDVIINVILIPTYGATGAAIGTLIAETVGLIIEFIILRKDIIPTLKKINYKIIIIACIGSYISNKLTHLLFNDINDLIVSFFLQAIVFFSSYFIILIICKDSLVYEGIYRGKQLLLKRRKR